MVVLILLRVPGYLFPFSRGYHRREVLVRDSRPDHGDKRILKAKVAPLLQRQSLLH